MIIQKCTHCGSDKIIGIEYGYGSNIPPRHQYDGISEIRCQECGYREGRWSGRELKEEDYERVYGETI